jgi:hypothetical protein
VLYRLHVAVAGPTNSGKTHNAIEALKRSSCGIYCSPLRLLALEQYDRLNQAGWDSSAQTIVHEDRHSPVYIVLILSVTPGITPCSI